MWPPIRKLGMGCWVQNIPQNSALGKITVNMFSFVSLYTAHILALKHLTFLSFGCSILS